MVACGGASVPPGAARRGPIIPAPLAQPQMRTSVWTGDSGPPTAIVVWAILTRVSVVIMACANASACSGVLPTEAFSAGIAQPPLSGEKGTPMMPVDDGMTSSKMQPKLSAAATQVAMQPSTPAGPVAQLALPEFTSTAPTRPPVESKWRWPTVTGAATTRFDVYTAAPTAQTPAASCEVATATATSGLPLALIPALAAPQTNPPGISADPIALLLISLLYQAPARGPSILP